MSGPNAEETDSGSLVRSSAVMAAGTIVSRVTGYLRSGLLVAALGSSLHADLFNIANTIPNMLYILLAGGVFNAVLVPQLVRALKNDPDGGEAFTNRIITAAGTFLLLVTVILVIGAPLFMQVLVDRSELGDPQWQSLVDLARYCLPQVFFYGMFVLVGQILNARGSFGPMMWAPIGNNLIAVAVLVSYLIVAGQFDRERDCAPYSTGAELWLGLGSTVGIVAQFLLLLPALRRLGFRFRPRFDLRNSGLGHTARLGMWTVLFVVVNQIAYSVVVRVASSGTVVGCATDSPATGYTVYANSFLLVMVPHAVITVSLATAVLPRLSSFAADGRFQSLAASLTETMRLTFALVAPALTMVVVLAPEVADLFFGWSGNPDDAARFVTTIRFFAVGVLFFTSHFLVLRGFYALERNRQVFWIQCVIAGVNIAAALLLAQGAEPAETAPRLVLAYAAAYLVGSVLSARQLSSYLGGLDGRVMLRFGVRLVVICGLTGGFAVLVRFLLEQLLGEPTKLTELAQVCVVGLLSLVLYLLLARALRVQEVAEVIDGVLGRFRRRSAPR